MVYVKTRSRENMEDFLKEFWTDQKVFLKDISTMGQLFTELTDLVKWEGLYDPHLSLSCFSDLFKVDQVKRSKSTNLSKYSYFEFIKRQKEETQNEDSIKTFLTNSSKKIDLSQRKFKIIDYGNCYDYSDERYGLINTRQYRAPEVILSNA